MAEGLVQLYRSSVLCDLLTDTLEELVEEDKLSQDLGVKVLAGFDKSCLEALQRRAEAKSSLSVSLLAMVPSKRDLLRNG